MTVDVSKAVLCPYLGTITLIIEQIQFYGNVTKSQEGSGKTVAHWEGGEHVTAIAYDVPIPGYATSTTNNLRLWSSKAASGEFDFQKFNSGEVLLLSHPRPEISKILIPSTSTRVLLPTSSALRPSAPCCTPMTI